MVERRGAVEDLGLSRRLKRLLPALLLLASSSAIGLLIAEGAVRLLAPQPLAFVTPGLYEPAPAPQRFRLRPGYRGTVRNGVEFDTRVRINEQGRRTAALMTQSSLPSAEQLGSGVIVVGDSFTFGWGVEAGETFVARLDRALPFVPVLNGGVPGTGMPDHAAWLEAQPALRPRLVLVAVFLGNDLLDATEAHRSVAVDNGLVAAAPTSSREPAPRGPRAFINDHSHLARLAKRALPRGMRRAVRDLLGLGEPWAESYLRDTFGSFALEPPPLVLEGQVATERAFARLVERARALDSRVALVLVPAAIQVDDRRWRAALDQLGVEGTAYDREEPSRFFGDLGARHDVPVLDLLPVLRDAAATRDATDPALYFRYDPHWTVAGHALAAEAMTPFVANLLDESNRLTVASRGSDRLEHGLRGEQARGRAAARRGESTHDLATMP